YRDLGIEEVLISLAEDGVLLAYEDKKIWYKHRQIDVKNATGGGDSFLGAYLVERLNGKNPQEAIYSAMAAAVVTIEKDVVYSRQLTRELIEETKKILEVKEFIL
ncbi:MAG: kinase, partial [Solobacterium sp.]|nr:kinase [Solobacterium sp.]